MIFNTKNNVPEVYTKKSRDFQLISSILDCIYNTLISNYNKMNYIDDLNVVDANLLNLISIYLGFFKKQYYPENLLRSILENFPYMIRNKGNYLGIEVAIKALQNAYTDITSINIDFTDLVNNSRVIIKTDGVLIDQKYIDEVLSYVLPVGLIIDRIIYLRDINNLAPDILYNQDYVRGIFFKKDDSEDYSLIHLDDSDYFYIGQIRKIYNKFSNGLKNYYLSKINHTPIITKGISGHVKIKQIANEVPDDSSL